LSGDIRVMLDTIDISDVLLSDLSKVDDGTGLTQVDQDITQAGVDDVPLEFKIVTTSTDEDAE
jgi:hypothetical protein